MFELSGIPAKTNKSLFLRPFGIQYVYHLRMCYNFENDHVVGKITPRKMNNEKFLLRDHKKHTVRGVAYTLFCPDQGVLPLDRTRKSTTDRTGYALPNRTRDRTRGFPLTPTPLKKQTANITFPTLRMRTVTSFLMLLLSDIGKTFTDNLVFSKGLRQLGFNVTLVDEYPCRQL